MRTFTAFILAAAATATLAQAPAPKPTPVATDPAVNTRPPLPKPLQPNLPTIFLVGDSTVRNGKGDGAGGQWGWGDLLAHYFDLARVNVTNRALGGRSSRTYITEGRWDETLALVKPGDVILFQFGHNDNGPLDDTFRARGTLPGTGPEAREIDNPITRQHETVHTYGWYLRKYVQDARRRGATPILCSLVPRKNWVDGHIQRSLDTYAGWAHQIALEEKTNFLDLNELIARRYDALGPEKVEPLFGDPHTHTSLAGAELNAEVVVSALKALATNPVAQYFSANAERVPAAKLEGK
jgi:lysophospholipase L1-like esterase